MWRRIGCIVLILVVGGIIAVVAVRAKTGKGGFSFKTAKKVEDEKKEPLFEPVKRGDLKIVVDATGVTQPITDIEVKSEATGRIVEFLVEEGDTVHKGDVICRLDQSNQVLQVRQQELAVKTAQLAYEQAKAGTTQVTRSAVDTAVASAQSGLDSAREHLTATEDTLATSQAAYDRIAELHKKGYATQAELDQARNNLEQSRSGLAQAEAQVRSAEAGLADAKTRQQEFTRGSNKTDVESARLTWERSKVSLQEARKQLGNSVISSPINGIILEKLLDVGDSVVSINSAFGQSNSIVKVADLSRVKVRTYVDEVDIGKIKINQPAEVTVDAFPGETFSGKITNIFPQGQTQPGGGGGLISFVIIIEVENPHGLLLGNMTSSVKIEALTIHDVLLIPLAATQAGKKPNTTIVQILKEPDADIYDAKTKTDEREVKIGETNFADTVVLEGLKEGDMVKVRGFESKIQFD
jgi:RND family efflux transporter MFP subunit